MRNRKKITFRLYDLRRRWSADSLKSHFQENLDIRSPAKYGQVNVTNE